MSNSLGLFLIGLGIGMLIVFVLAVQYLAKNRANTKIGQIARKIDQFIDRLPDE